MGVTALHSSEIVRVTPNQNVRLVISATVIVLRLLFLDQHSIQQTEQENSEYVVAYPIDVVERDKLETVGSKATRLVCHGVRTRRLPLWAPSFHVYFNVQ